MAFKMKGFTPFTQLDNKNQPGYKEDSKRFQVYKSNAAHQDQGYGASESYEFGKGGRDQDSQHKSTTIRHQKGDFYDGAIDDGMDKDSYSLTKSNIDKDGVRSDSHKKISKANYNIRKGFGRIKNILSGGSEESYKY